jgi:hypothetical protein
VVGRLLQAFDYYVAPKDVENSVRLKARTHLVADFSAGGAASVTSRVAGAACGGGSAGTE